MSGDGDNGLRVLAPADLTAAGETLSLAMHDDPFYAWVEPDGDRRRRWLDGFMRDTLGLLVADGHVYATADFTAVLGLSPPGAQPLPLRRTVPFAWRRLIRSPADRPPLGRLLGALRIFARIEKDHPHTPHWYVCIAGVHPGAQGRGLGGHMLRHVCALADRDGVPVCLETTNRANLAFYERFGFAVTDKVSPNPVAPPCWLMFRNTIVAPDS